MANPNPQSVAFAAFESIVLKVTMTPATNITGWTLLLNIRPSGNPSVITLQVTAFTITDAANGIFTIALTSAQTGTTLGTGEFDYDIWRIDVGFEKRLTWGPLSDLTEQWK